MHCDSLMSRKFKLTFHPVRATVSRRRQTVDRESCVLYGNKVSHFVWSFFNINTCLKPARSWSLAFLSFMNRSISLDNYLITSPSICQNIRFWSIGDQSSNDLSHCQGANGVFPLDSFNHLSREVLDLEKSIRFYSSILGFQEIARPALDCQGCWLFGYGVR
jgi:hypothetical protein